jgi:hypothetical protein
MRRQRNRFCWRRISGDWGDIVHIRFGTISYLLRIVGRSFVLDCGVCLDGRVDDRPGRPRRKAQLTYFRGISISPKKRRNHAPAANSV